MPKPSRFIRVTEHRKDKRIKLSDEDRAEIQTAHSTGVSQRALAREYDVSRRLIQFVLRPEMLERNKELRLLRGGWKQYYDKEIHRKTMASYRDDQDKIHTKKG